MTAWKTEFPRTPEHIRPIADEFVMAWSRLIGHRWQPAPTDKRRIVAMARDLYECADTNGQRCFRPGFIMWAVGEHLRRFPDCRYIPGPMSVRYLWDDYMKTQEDEAAKYRRDPDAVFDAIAEAERGSRERYLVGVD